MSDNVHVDGTLGPITWDEQHRWWRFKIALPDGRSVRGKILPETEGEFPDEQWLQLIRESVLWVQANEKELRYRVAEDMFDYWLQTYYDEEEDEVESPEEFAEEISISGINFHEQRPAEVWYDDAGLFGNHGIHVEIDTEGQFVDGPEFA